VALTKADGSGFVQIAKSGLYSNPFFSPDGSLLYYFKQRAIVLFHSLFIFS
jgi:hypothetical protein